MADIAAGDVAYVIERTDVVRGVGNRRRVKLTFGDNSLKYPTGGIPLDYAKLGCSNSLEQFLVLDHAGTAHLHYKWNRATKKLMVFVSDAGTLSVVNAGGAVTVAGNGLDGALAAPTISLTDDGDSPDAAIRHKNGALSENDATPTTGITGVQAPGLGTLVVDESALDVDDSKLSITGDDAGLAEHANATFAPDPAVVVVEVIGY